MAGISEDAHSAQNISGSKTTACRMLCGVCTGSIIESHQENLPSYRLKYFAVLEPVKQMNDPNWLANATNAMEEYGNEMRCEPTGGSVLLQCQRTQSA